MYPIIIPLAEDPKDEYKELKYTLRGIDKYYSGLREVIIIGPKKPPWATNVFFLSMNDLLEFDKDWNMINKIKTGIEFLTQEIGYNGVFTKFSDDFILLRKYDTEIENPKYFDELILSYKRIKKPIEYGEFVLTHSKFAERLKKTMDALVELGIFSPLNYETHTPQPYHTDDFDQVFSNVQGGVNINSFYLNLSTKFPNNDQITIDMNNQNRLAQLASATNIKEVEESVFNCKFLNLNGDDAFISFNANSRYSPIERYLMKRFKKSRFEK